MLNRQSFSRIHIQLDTVAERPSTIPHEFHHWLRLPNYLEATILPTTFHVSISLGELSIVWHEIYGSLL